jgi:hypothetical protein
MPKVKVSRAISGKKNEVFAAVKTYMEGRDTLKKLGADIDWDAKACTASIEGSNFNGAITVEEQKGKSLVEISIDLPLLLTPFKGKVEAELEKHLGRITV